MNEVERVLSVLNRQLIGQNYVAGENYTIADIAHFGWLWRTAAIGANLSQHSEVARWYARVEKRPAVQSALARIVTLEA